MYDLNRTGTSVMVFVFLRADLDGTIFSYYWCATFAVWTPQAKIIVNNLSF